jgi:hypothetical protein
MQEVAIKTEDRKKRPIDILRARRGGVSESLKLYVKEQQRIRKLLREGLKTGPKTVPQLAKQSGVEASRVLWHLMALRRYGEVVEGMEQEGYFLYELKEV